MTPETVPSTPFNAEPAEPQARRTPVPIWLLILLLLLLYWGAVHFDTRGGWFNEHVYAPYRTFDQVAAMQPVSGGSEVLLRGKDLYSRNCSVCHMDEGTGNPANNCPPLAGSEWVAAPGPGRIIRLVSKGGTGPIEVKGQVWNGGTMLAIGDQLTGPGGAALDEKGKSEGIAAIITYIRKVFGNNASPVTPEQVEAVRAQIKDRTAYFSAEELKAAPETP